MSNFKVAYYNDQNSGHSSSVIDVEIGRSSKMIGVNKGGLKVGNIVAVANNQNNIVQVVRVISKEHYAQPWKVDYKNVFNVEIISEDVIMDEQDKKNLFTTEKGSHTQWPTVSAQKEFVKAAIEKI
jgi:hypothetical protein